MPDLGGLGRLHHIVDVLNELGLRANLKIAHDEDYFATMEEVEAQAYVSGWESIYPSAHDFIDPQFRRGASFNLSGLCSRSLDAAIDRAQRLQATDPAAANSSWIEIEHQLVEDAIWVPLANPVSTYAFSDGTQNFQVHPQWGILLSRVWVQ